MGWRALDRALSSVEDYERCAREASPAVRWVRVRAAVNSDVKPGRVEVAVRGYGIGPFRRRLSRREERIVMLAIIERHPVGVELEMT